MTGPRIWYRLAACLMGGALAASVSGAVAAEPTDPAPPTVSSDIYPENEVGGGVGQTGTFTFASSADVTAYWWGSSDPPQNVAVPAAPGGNVTVRFTPTHGGPHILLVEAVNGTGQHSERVSYQFIVGFPAPAVARWPLADAAGSTSLADNTGNGHTALVDRGTLGVTGRIPGSATVGRFDGRDGAGATAEPLVDTSGSFSVAAWVRVTDTRTHRTAVSQDGTHTAGFQLQYAKGCACWRFLIPAADRVDPDHHAVRGSRGTVNVWTHLTGVYDSASGTLKLYVNGTLAGTATGHAAPWRATGPLTIGRSRWNDRATDFWAGDLADVQVWNRVLFDAEIGELADPLVVGRVGEWHMEEVGPGPAFDSTGFANDLSFFDGAEIPPAPIGQTGAGLRLNGSTAYAASAGPVVWTDQSFTASAWVRLSDASTARTALALEGANADAFALRCVGGRWVFEARERDRAGATPVRAASPTPARLDAWVQLIGVYDADARRLLLYVDGQPVATAAFGKAWRATGALTLGRGGPGATAGFWAGDLDEVRVYAGVVTDPTRIP